MALDQSALNELRALDADGSCRLLAKIINAYLNDTPALIGQMQATLAANDVESFTRHAHSLKSTSLSLGASRVGQIARDLEMAGKNNTIAGCPALIETLTAAYAAAAALLQAELATPAGGAS